MSDQYPIRGWPGWYLDQDDPTRIHYWDGTRWTGRRRQRPMWTLGGDEGLLAVRQRPGRGQLVREHLATEDDPSLAERPAHLPEVSARATARPTWGLLAEGRSAGGLPGHRRRRQRLYPPGPMSSLPPPWGPATPRLLRQRPWTARWTALVALVAIGVLAIVGAKAFQPAANRGPVITDVSWLQAADAVCTTSLPRIRNDAGRPAIDNRRQTEAQMIQMADGLDAVANRLERLPARPTDQPSIRLWLQSWRRFDGWQRQYAHAIEPSSDSKQAAGARAQATTAQQQADQFALANDLTACLI